MHNPMLACDISQNTDLQQPVLPAEELVRKKVKEPSDFEWLKQCRFYWREDKQTVIISICDVDFEYSFEYLGNFKLLACQDIPLFH